MLLPLLITPVLACGPWFPNTMLNGGDETLLEAPASDFRVELDRIAGSTARFQAVMATNGPAAATFDTDYAELQAALVRAGRAPAEQEDALTRFREVREQLMHFAAGLEQWRDRQHFRAADEPPSPRPVFNTPGVPDGLPAEFADYLAGSIAFYAGDTNVAQAAWIRLLDRPRAERHYRSTWAAFMLGKTMLDTAPEKAVLAFQLVRELAQAGFADALGLAASSYGWEARIELREGHFTKAVELYLEQHRTGDATALESLRFTARKVLDQNSEELAGIAAVPFAQRVVTAYIVSRHGLTDIASADETTRLIETWLQAVEQGRKGAVAGADRLALTAYQRGLFELAQRWLNRAGKDSAVGQWVRAKLLLREGKVAEAAKTLAAVVRLFEAEGDWGRPPGMEPPPNDEFPHWDDESPFRQAMGELGVLRLTRREYYEALDLLVRSGFWSDAAYVAEYVLTPDELMAYVERQWPASEFFPQRGGIDSRDYLEAGRPRPNAIAIELRYLTGRRLARLQRWDEALDFLPLHWKGQLEKYVSLLQNGRDSSRPAEARAQNLWEAAQIARQEGMELFGTEVEPDWHLVDGQYDMDALTALRAPSPGSSELRPTREPLFAGRPVTLQLSGSSFDEKRRVEAHRVSPDLRFHYRYLAADLGWEAAQLMPDNNEATARVLWRAGTWLKVRDPIFADRFYKALVRRCGATPLGQAADRLRWFPKSDAPEDLMPPPNSVPGPSVEDAPEPSSEEPPAVDPAPPAEE